MQQVAVKLEALNIMFFTKNFKEHQEGKNNVQDVLFCFSKEPLNCLGKEINFEVD